MFLPPLAILGIAFLGGEVVKYLWNALVPQIFGLPHLSFWQALGLLALSRILFGGLRLGGRGRRSRFRHRMRERLSGRWERMTPDERERFRQGLRGRCDFPPPSPEGQDPALR